MSNPTPKQRGGTSLPEFMTSPGVADFFAEWLGEQVQAAEQRAIEGGNSRALAWELRTLKRAHAQLRPHVVALLADES